MILQLAVTLGASVNLAHSEPFYSHRLDVGLRYRPCPAVVAPVCLHAGGLVALDNGVPGLQVVNDGTLEGPSGSVLTHFAVGADAPLGPFRVGPVGVRTQRALPHSAAETAVYYVTGNAMAEWAGRRGFVRVERAVATFKQWRLGVTQTMGRAALRVGPVTLGAHVEEVVPAPDVPGSPLVGYGGSVRWKAFTVGAGVDVVPRTEGAPELVRNRYVRTGIQLSLGGGR